MPGSQRQANNMMQVDEDMNDVRRVYKADIDDIKAKITSGQ